jgi:succinate dehydrogenase/fumarate reductase cytochrome b subunit
MSCRGTALLFNGVFVNIFPGKRDIIKHKTTGYQSETSRICKSFYSLSNVLMIRFFLFTDLFVTINFAVVSEYEVFEKLDMLARRIRCFSGCFVVYSLQVSVFLL